MSTKTHPTATPIEPSAALLLPGPAAASRLLRLQLKDLIHEAAFTPRLGLAKGHVHELARTHRHGTELDPIKVWREPETGRLIILDGRHRVAAYRMNKAKNIPARLFEGDRKDARLEAAKDNAKTSFPWTTTERTRYAWGLVIDCAGSKKEIVQASNISTGTVTRLRTSVTGSSQSSGFAHAGFAAGVRSFPLSK